MILNLTQHVATKEQLRDGAIEPKPEHKKLIQELITFDKEVIGKPGMIRFRCHKLVNLVKQEYPEVHEVMIGGAPYLIPYLVTELKENRISPYFSYTDRVSEEVQNPDGTITKTQVFKHLGWVYI